MADITQHRPPLSRRRDKPQLSCHFCRRRKRRCDRGSPCGTCVKLGRPSSSCTYADDHLAGGEPGVEMESNGVAEQLQRLEYRLAAVQSVAAIASQDANTTTAQDQLDNQTSDAAMESIGTAPYTLPPSDNPLLPRPGKILVQPQVLRIDMDFADISPRVNRHSNPTNRQQPFRYDFYINPDAPVYHSIGMFPI